MGLVGGSWSRDGCCVRPDSLGEEHIMNKIIVASMASCALAFGAAGTVHAQADEPTIEIDNPEPAAGDTINVDIAGGEPEAEVELELGGETASGVTDADGAASLAVTVPESVELGELDGLVVINGVEYPIQVVVQAIEGDAAGGDDSAAGTTPTEQDLPSTGPDDPATLAVLALGLLLAGASFLAIARGRRSAA